MALDRDWLLGVAKAERVALGTTIQYTDPSKWEAESPCEGWRVKDVLAHLGASEAATAAIVAGEATPELDAFNAQSAGDEPSVDDFNGWTVPRRKDVPATSLAKEWGEAADLLLLRAAEAGEDAWLGQSVSWFESDLPLAYLIELRVSEWWVHGEDIRRGAGLPPRREHPPVFCVNDFAIRSLPFWLERNERTAEGKSVKIELDGVGEGEWHYALAPGERPDPDAKPDVWITGTGIGFAYMVAGRMDTDVALYEGMVNAGGDRDLAEAVLENLRYSAG